MLLIDGDPQGSLTISLGYEEPDEMEYSLATLIQRVMEVYGDSREEAKKNIRRSDKARSAYYKHISGRTWGEKENYELVIDSSCGVEKAVDMIIEYLAMRNRF